MPEIKHSQPPLPFTEAPPVARRTDPGTSWEAAESVRNVRESQRRVYAILGALHGATDEEMINEARVMGWLTSESGLRTRRAELVDMGHVADSGKRRLTRGGRQSIVWVTASERPDHGAV